MFRGVLGHGRIIDVAGIQIFPPNPISTLPQVPGNNSLAILLQRVQWHHTALPNPVNIVAPTDDSRLRVAEIVVELARVIGHFGHVLMNPEFHSQGIQTFTQIGQRGGLGFQFFVGLLSTDGIGIATEHAKTRLLANFGCNEDLFHNFFRLGGFVQSRAGIKAYRLKTFRFELRGKSAILVRARDIEVSLQVIVSGVAQGGEHFLNIEGFTIALRILTPSVNVRAYQSFLTRPNCFRSKASRQARLNEGN
jgi:hypothetical protein